MGEGVEEGEGEKKSLNESTAGITGSKSDAVDMIVRRAVAMGFRFCIYEERNNWYREITPNATEVVGSGGANISDEGDDIIMGKATTAKAPAISDDVVLLKEYIEKSITATRKRYNREQRNKNRIESERAIGGAVTTADSRNNIKERRRKQKKRQQEGRSTMKAPKNNESSWAENNGRAHNQYLSNNSYSTIINSNAPQTPPLFQHQMLEPIDLNISGGGGGSNAVNSNGGTIDVNSMMDVDIDVSIFDELSLSNVLLPVPHNEETPNTGGCAPENRLSGNSGRNQNSGMDVSIIDESSLNNVLPSPQYHFHNVQTSSSNDNISSSKPIQFTNMSNGPWRQSWERSRNCFRRFGGDNTASNNNNSPNIMNSNWFANF